MAAARSLLACDWIARTARRMALNRFLWMNPFIYRWIVVTALARACFFLATRLRAMRPRMSACNRTTVYSMALARRAARIFLHIDLAYASARLASWYLSRANDILHHAYILVV